ncbi:hypothetical protein N5079_32605 [Planotetraspora sp. A-T 1434]|uniref:hypothetical protein n=1 Tax=Planotetraspora sp. A-T 1434 TaxID=2979219 RepID=UPI0021BE6D4B|nr:hypothetical protein [Planotetraspora sp. A-T 1434]MCT9934959.1 hypothetical protein [Planotetraspora sp. A-T 1434]
MALTACGAPLNPANRVQVATTTSSLVANEASLAAKEWTKEDVATLFLTPADAGLVGGETRSVPPGTTSRISVCVPLNPLNTPTVPEDKRYATAKQEIGLPYKGHLTQQGWVLPTEAHASTLMRKVGRKVPQCRYSGASNDPMDPGTRISGTSAPEKYARDDFGWHGHRIEQAMSVNGKRASVSTVLLLQRGPVVLALDYTNYTPKAPEQALRAYNMTILRKILAHPAR